MMIILVYALGRLVRPKGTFKAALGRLVAWGVDGARSSCLQVLKRAAQDALAHQAHMGWQVHCLITAAVAHEAGAPPRLKMRVHRPAL